MAGELEDTVAQLVDVWLDLWVIGKTTDPSPRLPRLTPCSSCSLSQDVLDELGRRLTDLIDNGAKRRGEYREAVERRFALLVQLHSDATGRSATQVRADVHTLLQAATVVDQAPTTTN